MKSRPKLIAAFAALFLCACASQPGWITLIDGEKGLDNWNRVSNANWRGVDGAIQADAKSEKANAYLVSKNAYTDFQIRAEFWASHDANSGIFMRCSSATEIGDKNCYEANIFDQRPDQTYATGAIVKVAPVAQPAPRAGGKWNTFDILMEGDHLVVLFNGVKTVDVRDKKFASGPIALQWGRGTIKWRKVEVQRL